MKTLILVVLAIAAAPFISDKVYSIEKQVVKHYEIEKLFDSLTAGIGPTCQR